MFFFFFFFGGVGGGGVAMGVTMSDPSISFFKTYCTRSFISFKQIGMNTENIEPQKAIKFSFDSCL